MVTTLDRYIARQFGLNYVISFSVLVSLYIVLDLFFNLDEFYQGTDLGMYRSGLAIMWLGLIIVTSVDYIVLKRYVPR